MKRAKEMGMTNEIEIHTRLPGWKLRERVVRKVVEDGGKAKWEAR